MPKPPFDVKLHAVQTLRDVSCYGNLGAIDSRVKQESISSASFGESVAVIVWRSREDAISNRHATARVEIVERMSPESTLDDLEALSVLAFKELHELPAKRIFGMVIARTNESHIAAVLVVWHAWMTEDFRDCRLASSSD